MLDTTNELGYWEALKAQDAKDARIAELREESDKYDWCHICRRPTDHRGEH